MAVTKAHINPQVLQWARKRLFPTVEAASGPLRVSAKRLERWERGEDSPTFNQARKMADRLRIPFGYFYLSSPPPEEPFPLPDLRNDTGSPPSIDLVEVIHDAQRKQAWYREEMQYQQRSPLPFVGRFSLESPPEDIAEDICYVISVDEEARKAADSWQSFLARFVEQTERYGVLVLRSGVAAGNTHRKLNVDEFRGFALPDPLAPVVFVNAQDSIPAQAFTLACELAHIWLNEPCVSSPDFRLDPVDYENPVEQVCHSVAAKVLEPETAFLRKAATEGKPGGNSYWKQYDAKAAKYAYNKNTDNHLTPILARNSEWFTEKLIAALAKERVGFMEVLRLLGVRVDTLDSLARHFWGVSLKSV